METQTLSPSPTLGDLQLHITPPAPGTHPEPLDWESIFGRRAPLALEIGTGNGVFMAAEAARHPGWDFIGIEREPEFFEKFRKRMVREGRTNVRCIGVDAMDLLPHIFAPGALSRVICLFSDPWHKRRHRERRVFRPRFLGVLETMLHPGGTLHYKTDVGWYFNLTVELFRARPGWTITEIGPVSQGEVITNFEGKARAAGVSIWGFTARWEGGSVPEKPVQ